MAGVLFGMFLRARLSERYLGGDTEDVVRLGTGLIGTIAGLVLGLLIASANSSYETRNTQIKQLTANVILLDNLLAQYGPETEAARVSLRTTDATLADRIWNENASGSGKEAFFDTSGASEAASAKIFELSPTNDAQRELKNRAIQTSTDIAQTRLLLFAQRGTSLPMPFLVVLVFWLTIIFASFSLFARPNLVVIGSLFIFALSASAAIFLILELGQPFAGLMKISNVPLHDALAPLVP